MSEQPPLDLQSADERAAEALNMTVEDYHRERGRRIYRGLRTLAEDLGWRKVEDTTPSMKGGESQPDKQGK
jgi:hypothetical protein